MPIYEYVCTGCDKKFELLRPFSRADEEAECPECGKNSERVISRVCCASSDENGIPYTVGGGSSCSSCGSSNCSTCSMN